MATNKNAQIRYHALDRCLGNWSRRFYIEDLIKACNDALYDYNGSEGVQKRQVQKSPHHTPGSPVPGKVHVQY